MTPVRYVLIHEFMKAYLIKEVASQERGSIQDNLEKQGYEVLLIDELHVGFSGNFYQIRLKDGEEEITINGNATIHTVT